MDDDFFVLVQFQFLTMLLNLLKRNERRALNVRDGVLVGQTAIDKLKFLALVHQRFHLARGHFPIGLERITGR